MVFVDELEIEMILYHVLDIIGDDDDSASFCEVLGFEGLGQRCADRQVLHSPTDATHVYDLHFAESEPDFY